MLFFESREIVELDNLNINWLRDTDVKGHVIVYSLALYCHARFIGT